MPHQDMLVNYVPGEECRIALVEDGKLEELYTERASDDIHVGNIYRGRVTNVEPSIQAAFIDFGLERNGFLHVSDLHPRYFPGNDSQTERVGHRTPRKERPPIQQCLKRGQRILVQVLKEGIGTKGPTLTSYLSIPGRFLVMMPDMERHGVSRKIEDEEKRREMRKILDDLDPPGEFGFIVRTAGIGRTKTELKRDLAYLMRLWKTIESRQDTSRKPAELYRESDLVIRTLRDVLTNDVKRIIVDDRGAAERAKDFIRIAMPRASVKVIHYDKPVPLLDSFDIERQIETIHSREVPLLSGGSLVIDSTEALVAIDVNSGKSRDNKDAEATAYETNKEAIPEIARQLRLRDLGGLVVLDLIDMYQHKHRRAIEQRFRDELKKDRARSKITRINDIGLLSLTRQRMRPSLQKSIHKTCTHCKGTGVIKTAESVALDVMRRLAVVLSSDRVERVELRVSPTVGAMLLNRKRHALHRLEQHLNKPIAFKFDPAVDGDDITLIATDEKGVQLDLDKLPAPKPPEFDDSDLITFDAIDNAPDEYDDEEAENGGDPESADEAEPTTDAGPSPRRDSQRNANRDSDDPRRKPETGGASSGDDRHGRRDTASTTDDDPSARGGDTGESSDAAGSDDAQDQDQEQAGGKRKRRRRRRGGRGRRKRGGAENENGHDNENTASKESGESGADADASRSDAPASSEAEQPEATPADHGAATESEDTGWNPPLNKTGSGDTSHDDANAAQDTQEARGESDEPAGETSSEDKPRKRRRRRGGRGRRRKSDNGDQSASQSSADTDHNGDQSADESTPAPAGAVHEPDSASKSGSPETASDATETADATGPSASSDAGSSDADRQAPSDQAGAESTTEASASDEPTEAPTGAASDSQPKPKRRRKTKKRTAASTAEPTAEEPDAASTTDASAEAEADADAAGSKKKTKSTRKKQTGKTTKKKTTRRSSKAAPSDAGADTDTDADSTSTTHDPSASNAENES